MDSDLYKIVVHVKHHGLMIRDIICLILVPAHYRFVSVSLPDRGKKADDDEAAHLTMYSRQSLVQQRLALDHWFLRDLEESSLFSVHTGETVDQQRAWNVKNCRTIVLIVIPRIRFNLISAINEAIFEGFPSG